MEIPKFHSCETDPICTLQEMADAESILTEFERNAALEIDSLSRFEQLLSLNRWYRKKFGVLFEVRHSLRNELILRAQNETRSALPAAITATQSYERVRGSQASRLLASIIQGGRVDAYRNMSSS